MNFRNTNFDLVEQALWIVGADVVEEQSTMQKRVF